MSLETILKQQFDRCLATKYPDANGTENWIDLFLEAGKVFSEAPDILMGIGSRETNIRDIKGDWHDDLYHGFGIGQDDVNADPDFVKSGAWADPKKSIYKLAEVLHAKRQWLEDHEGQTILIKDHAGNEVRFTVAKFEGDIETKVAVASYNAGSWAAYHQEKHGDADRGTKGHNYSADVLSRAAIFKTWIDEYVGNTDKSA